jgi:histidine triad (HIT) family protein
MQDSIFTKIIKGEIPSYKIYEDELTFAFLDIHPKTPGHVLVATVKKGALRIREVLHAKYVGEQVVGMDIPHTHIHVFPFSNMEEYLVVPDMSADPDQAALTEMAQKLAF